MKKFTIQCEIINHEIHNFLPAEKTVFNVFSPSIDIVTGYNVRRFSEYFPYRIEVAYIDAEKACSELRCLDDAGQVLAIVTIKPFDIKQYWEYRARTASNKNPTQS